MISYALVVAKELTERSGSWVLQYKPPCTFSASYLLNTQWDYIMAIEFMN